MNRTVLTMGAILVAGMFAMGCDDDGSGGSGGSTGGNNTGGTSSSTGGGGGTGGTGETPPRPELGSQIDRMGRPAINTALNGAFALLDGQGNPVISDNTAREAQQDDYNEDDQPAEWAANYGNLFALNLGLLDVLDEGVDLDGPGPNMPQSNEAACEDQPLSCGNITGPVITCYSALAGALATDILWMRVDGTNCSSAEPNFAAGEGYLALEFDGLGLAPNDDCGGRRPIDDVIDRTYSVIVAGLPTGVDDLITAPAGRHPETFPYMAPPL